MKTKHSGATCVLGLLFSTTFSAISAETRYHEYTRKFGNPEHGIEVVSAGYFGGQGHEWIAAGAFSPGGSIVLAGNFLGPGAPDAKVLGKDGAAPENVSRTPEIDSKGNPRLNKDGSPKFNPLSWTDEGVTGFVIRTSPDMKTVLSTHRLPFESSSITACVVSADGAIYLAGKAGKNIANLSRDTRELETADNGMESGQCDHTFVAKLAADASEVIWVRHLKGNSNAPKLEIMNDGSLKSTAQDLRNISPDGEETGRLVVRKGLSHITAVNPADGSIIRAGEHHSPTGREPWRCPVLNIFNPDGTQRHQLYDWLGPYVGLDNLRLVSDTAVRRVTFDQQGNIVLYLWSDGGNSVALREPFDVRTFSPNTEGLGFSAWGANVLSAAYLIKVDPETLRVKNGTMWMSYLEDRNKPNSAWIDQIAFAPDGSACFTGRAASSIIQTDDRLSPAQSGQYVAVLAEDLASIRFSSAIPGTGSVKTGNAEETWNIATTSSGGRQRVLFVSGSSGGENEFETPVKNASQEKFGGGWSDGYAVLLEMDDLPAPTKEAIPNPPSDEWDVVSAEKPAFSDSKGLGPVSGQTFVIEPQKWVTTDVEIRDSTGKLWPTFLYGKPEKGKFSFDPDRPAFTATLKCNRMCQPDGTATGRVVSPTEWLDGEDIDFTFEIRSIGAFEEREETRKTGTRNEKRRSIYAPVDCVLKIRGRSVPVKAECRFEFKFPKDSKQPDSVQIDSFFSLPAKDLGLKNPDPESEIDFRISVKAAEPE